MSKEAFKAIAQPTHSLPEYVPHKVLPLKGHNHFNEMWLQTAIQNAPEILGLGPLVVLQRERRQPRAGRLDLLLEDSDTGRRYTIELQLGIVDESHIIRTVEYWDNERKRNPQIDHCAVICAETINARFLNVISLFNGQIPLIALQVNAVQVDNRFSLVFTKVLDEVERGVDEDRDTAPEIGRTDWEKRSSAELMACVDRIARDTQIVIDAKFELKYTTVYIGCTFGGRPANFVAFKPQRNSLRLDLGMKLSPEQIKTLNDANIEVLDYAPYWRVHPIRLSKEQAANPPSDLYEILKLAYLHYFE